LSTVIKKGVKYRSKLFPMEQQTPVGQGHLNIKASRLHADTLGRTPLDEWSARRRGIYL